GRLDELLNEKRELLKLGLEQDQARGGEMRRAVGNPEGMTGDRLGFDREATRLERKPAMIGIEAEPLALAATIVDADEPLAAEIELEARAFERPVLGNADLGMMECGDSLARRPRRTGSLRRTVEGPVGERLGRAHRPQMQFDKAFLEAIDPLVAGKRHFWKVPL